MNTIKKTMLLSSSGSNDAHISGETLSLLEEQPVKATHHQRGRGSKTVAGFVVCALSLGSALALSSSTSNNNKKDNNNAHNNNNVESLFARGSPMAQ